MTSTGIRLCMEVARHAGTGEPFRPGHVPSMRGRSHISPARLRVVCYVVSCRDLLLVDFARRIGARRQI